MKRNFLILFLASIASLGIANAKGVKIGELYYELNYPAATAMVTYETQTAHENYQNLTSVNIPTAITYNDKTYQVVKIDNDAFHLCATLTDITIPEGIIEIGSYVFVGCNNLSSIFIPSSVENIGLWAFSMCENLQSINVDDNNTNYCSIDGVLFNKDTTTLIQYPNGKYGSYIVPSMVQIIGNGAFMDSKELTSVILGEKVKKLERFAFNSCSDLQLVEMNTTLEIIEDEAFYGSNLQSVTIPDSVKKIGSLAFDNCRHITSVVWNAKHVISELGNPFYDSRETITSFVIGNEVEYLPNSLCAGLINLTSITIPNSVVRMGYAVFHECANLDSITIPNTLTKIEAQTFAECANLSSISIPNSIDSIFSDAFRGCASLISIEIPESVNYLGKGTFRRCTGLKTISIPSSVSTIEEDLFSYCTNLSSINLPESIIKISRHAFRNCNSLTSISIPKNVSTLCEGAFDGCNNIDSVLNYSETPQVLPSRDVFFDDIWSCKLYVPKNAISLYKEAEVWKEFAQIRPIGNWCLVEFYESEMCLSSEFIEYGTAAIAPEPPTYAAVEFVWCDKDFSCVTEDMIVNAIYQTRRCKVRFIDWDGSVIDEQIVLYFYSAQAPNDPYREGYTFIGWDKDFFCIQSDLDIYAQYEPNKEGLDDILLEETSLQKIVIDGEIFIIRGEQVYTLQGQKVK